MNEHAEWRTLKGVEAPFSVYVYKRAEEDSSGALMTLHRRNNLTLEGELVKVTTLNKSGSWNTGETEDGREVIFGGNASKSWIVLP